MDNIIQFVSMFVHIISGTLWWGFAFFIVFIINPKNKKGIISFILPTVQKYVVAISTITIISGILLMLVNMNFDWNKSIESFWGKSVIFGGIFAIPPYLRVLSSYSGCNLIPSLSLRNKAKFAMFLPHLYFGMLTFTIIIMIYSTQLL